MNVLLCLSHSIEEYDQLRLLSGLGYTVASIGGYIDPRHPHDDKRPALDIDVVPEIKAAVDSFGTADNLGAAQTNLPPAILDWADVIIFHHYLPRLFGQWPAIRAWLDRGSHRRVIWRTVGQSVTNNEEEAAPFRKDGLEIVRYSPKERNIPGYAGEDALIRFYKDPAEWDGWEGFLAEDPFIVNFTQHDATPHGRDEWVNWAFWEAATQGYRVEFGGPHTDLIGGHGSLPIGDMQSWLRHGRVYLYTGTQPASYTLGLIEAMMTGIPVVSIAPQFMRIFPYGPDLFEGLDIAGYGAGAADGYIPSDEQVIANTRDILGQMLTDPRFAYNAGRYARLRAIELFGMATIGAQWKAFLGA